MAVRSLSTASITRGTTVVVRLDLNVPVEKGRVMDDTRIVASLPTLQWLIDRGARVIVLAHLGRPDGKRDRALSLKPVFLALSRLVKYPTHFFTQKIGSSALKKALATVPEASCSLLENIRFYPGEEENDPVFARALASLGDVFVNDGFSVSHRSAASVVGIARHLLSVAGLLLEKEVRALTRVLQPKKPAVLIMGGMKIETKLPVIEHLLPKFDIVLLAGGVGNTLLSAAGYRLGDTMVDRAYFKQARALAADPKVYMPVDVVVGARDGSHMRHVPIPNRPAPLVPPGMQVFDIGPATIALFREFIHAAATIVWNGPLGFFEQQQYRLGTMAMASMVGMAAKEGAFAVVGGGETIEAIMGTHVVHCINHVSTAGGAMLAFLSGKTLPGIAVLEK